MTEKILTEREVWAPCYVAETEDEAIAQAQVQFRQVDGRLFRVTRFTGQIGNEGWQEWDIKGRGVVVRVWDLFSDAEWDGDTMYPEWRVRFQGRKYATTIEGDRLRLSDIDYPGYTAPGIGTAEGFGHHEQGRLIWPEKVGVA